MKQSVETRSASITSADTQLPAQERPSPDPVELSDNELEKVAGGGDSQQCPDCGMSYCMCGG